MAVIHLGRGPHTVEVGGPEVVLMGVINRSPESAIRDVYAPSKEAAVDMAGRYAELGVRVIDVGGQSTNYANADIGAGEELRRLLPTVEALVAAGHVVSVDTWKAEVAAAAIEAGAALVNDTGGLKDPAMVEVLAAADVPAVLMYLEAATPNEAGDYDTSVGKSRAIRAAIAARHGELAAAGVSQVIIDPGIAISYRTDYTAYTRVQFEVAAHLDRLAELDAPVLYAVPRKDDLYRNVALAALAMHSGADMLRIHDVEEIADVARLMGRLGGEMAPA